MWIRAACVKIWERARGAGAWSCATEKESGRENSARLKLSCVSREGSFSQFVVVLQNGWQRLLLHWSPCGRPTRPTALRTDLPARHQWAGLPGSASGATPTAKMTQITASGELSNFCYFIEMYKILIYFIQNIIIYIKKISKFDSLIFVRINFLNW